MGWWRVLARVGYRAMSLAVTYAQRMRAIHLADRWPRSLSGGESQRVALARALASWPRLLLLDEAFSALHQTMRQELLCAVRNYARETNVPVLYVTHQRDEAEPIADRVIVLEGGRIVRAELDARR